MNKDQITEITQRLDTIIKLIAFEKIEDKNTKEKVLFLVKAGLSPAQVSKLIEKPINTITSYTSRFMKKRQDEK